MEISVRLPIRVALACIETIPLLSILAFLRQKGSEKEYVSNGNLSCRKDGLSTEVRKKSNRVIHLNYENS